ncbi:MAG: GNAT family N-acetyltransferase [Deltaproteobacteria bacterium]
MPDISSMIEKTFFANYRSWGGLHSPLYHSGSIWAMKTGIESADLNGAWSEKPLMPDDGKAIRDIKKSYQRAGLPFWWWVFPGSQSPSTIAMLKAEAFSFIDSIPSMLADLILLPDEEPCNAAVSVIHVTSYEELSWWEDVSFAGFDFPSATKEQYHRFVSAFSLKPESPHQFFLARWNGKPVATSLLFLNGDAAGVYFVTTLADCRKKGMGLELTRATMRFAKSAGARYATLQSSPDGVRVYKQAGFKEYCQTAVYSLSAR